MKLAVRSDAMPGPDWAFDIPEFDLQPGTTVDKNAQITKPAGEHGSCVFRSLAD